MAATGVLHQAVTAVAGLVTAAGFQAVTDPRAVRPYCVFIELPTFTGFTKAVADITIRLRLLAPPPGDANAAEWLLNTADTLMAVGNLAVIDGAPSIAMIGNQDLPAYDLTCRIGINR